MADCNFTARDVALANVKIAKEENQYELIKCFKEDSFCDFMTLCEELKLITEQIRGILYWSSLKFEKLNENYSEEDPDCVREILDALGLTDDVFEDYNNNHEKVLTRYVEDREYIRSFVQTDCQIWTSEAIKELKEKYNIIFSPNSTHAIKIVENKNRVSSFIIGIEDDGCIYFDKKSSFNSVWTSSLIDLLKEADLIAQ